MNTLIQLSLTALILFCGSCVQRECSYNPKTGEVRYKSNHFATDASVEALEVVFQNGMVIRFNHFKQVNDSVKVIVPPYGAIETIK